MADRIDCAMRLQEILAQRGVPFSVEWTEEVEHPFVRAASDAGARARGADQIYTPEELEEVWRAYQVAERYELYKHLDIMPKCVEVMKKRRGDTPGGERGSALPLADHVVFTIHHLDDKAYAAHAVLREWGGTDMTAVFVGYNALMSAIYRPQLDDIPLDQFRTCIINGDRLPGAGRFAEKVYRIVRAFSRFPCGEELPNDAFDSAFGGRGEGARMTYLLAMRALTSFLFLRDLRRARATGRKLILFEDGGYLHPILSEAVLNNWTIAEFRRAHSAPEEPSVDADLGPHRPLADVLRGTFVGSTEWTRNGYDRSVALQLARGALPLPIFSNACSRVKTAIEGDLIAVACLNAIESVLYALGASMKKRNVLILGARGNIGRFFAAHLADILECPERQLISCDLKSGWDPVREDAVPPWATSPNARIERCLFECSTYDEIPKAYRLKLDLIFGLTGGPSGNHETVCPHHMVEWLLEGRPDTLYLASGSTKTAEFSKVLAWLDDVMRRHASGEAVQIGGRCLRAIEAGAVRDELAEAALRETLARVFRDKPDVAKAASEQDYLQRFGRTLGTHFTFTIEGESPHAAPIWKRIVLMANTTPINFMYFGTPAEVLDWSYAQLLDITAELARQSARGSLAGRMYATDYSREATLGVFEAEALDRDYVVPNPPGIPP